MLDLSAVVAQIVIGILVEQSRFFAAGGWWSSATGLEQSVFGAAFVLVVLPVAGTLLAAVAAIFSKQWREQFWKPKLIRIPLRVVRAKTYNELKARPKPTSRPGMRVYVPGVKKYGELETREDMSNKTLRVQ